MPVSALRGDHVASARGVAWHDRPALLELPEGLPAGTAADEGVARRQVHFVGRAGGASVAGGASGEHARVY